jgi:glycine/serine hydroxymethyltransferase
VSGHAGATTPDAVEQHITQLHTQLKITAAEQPLWDQFAQVMRDNARDMSQAFDQRGTKLASLNAAENMQSYAQLAQQHAQDLQKLAGAFQTLYAAMPDDQKALADRVFRTRPASHSAHPKA